MENMEQPELRYPDARKNLIHYIRCLADKDFQLRHWIHNETPKPGFGNDSTMVINGIGDTLDWNNPEKSIGLVLLGPEEASEIRMLLATIDETLASLPSDIEDAELINFPLWNTVIQSARRTYTVLTGGKNAEGYFNELRSV
jgi:hypothetical protein